MIRLRIKARKIRSGSGNLFSFLKKREKRLSGLPLS